MPRVRRTTEQVINTLKQAEVLLGEGWSAAAPPLARASLGKSVAEVAIEPGVTEHTCYRWREEYGGVRTDQAKRLKRLVADLSLDNAILKDAAAGDFAALNAAGLPENMQPSTTTYLNGEHVGYLGNLEPRSDTASGKSATKSALTNRVCKLAVEYGGTGIGG